MSDMPNIIVRRYENPAVLGYAGWIEPATREWIAFIGDDHRVEIHLDRDPETGAILD